MIAKSNAAPCSVLLSANLSLVDFFGQAVDPEYTVALMRLDRYRRILLDTDTQVELRILEYKVKSGAKCSCCPGRLGFEDPPFLSSFICLCRRGHQPRPIGDSYG